MWLRSSRKILLCLTRAAVYLSLRWLCVRAWLVMSQWRTCACNSMLQAWRLTTCNYILLQIIIGWLFTKAMHYSTFPMHALRKAYSQGMSSWWSPSVSSVEPPEKMWPTILLCTAQKTNWIATQNFKRFAPFLRFPSPPSLGRTILSLGMQAPLEQASTGLKNTV